MEGNRSFLLKEISKSLERMDENELAKVLELVDSVKSSSVLSAYAESERERGDVYRRLADS